MQQVSVGLGGSNGAKCRKLRTVNICQDLSHRLCPGEFALQLQGDLW